MFAKTTFSEPGDLKTSTSAKISISNFFIITILPYTTYKKVKGLQIDSWRDIIVLYELDVGDHNIKFLHKLTDAHVYNNRLKKIKVKIAAQVFSRAVHGIMVVLVKYGSQCLPTTAAGTADFILLWTNCLIAQMGLLLHIQMANHCDVW